MTTQVQKNPQLLLNDLQNLIVSVHILESQSIKGREVDENDRSLPQAIDEIRSEYVQLAKSISKEFGSAGKEMGANKRTIEFMASKYDKKFDGSPEEPIEFLKQFASDMEELFRKATMLIERDKKREEERSKIEKSLEEANEAERTAHEIRARTKSASKAKDNLSLSSINSNDSTSTLLAAESLNKIASSSKSFLSQAGVLSPRAKSTRVLDGSKNRGKSQGDKKSNLRYAKSTDAKEREEFLKQRALKKHEMQMERQMAPVAQMSRN